MGYSTQDIADIGNAFLEDYRPDGKWYDAQRSYRQHIGTSELFSRRVMGAAADTFTWPLKTSAADNTVVDGFFSKDTLNRVDLSSKASGRYSLQKSHYMWDKREPAFMNKNRLEIFNYLKMQESDCYDGFFEANENFIWTLPTAPNDGSAGDILPYAIPYFLVQSTTAAFDFNGGEATGYSLTVGLEKDANSSLRNGTFTYSSIDDMEDKLNDALDLTNFKAPYKGSAALGEDVPEMNYGIYSSRKPYKDYQTLLYASNDNIGPDYGKFRNRITGGVGPQMYRGVPWTEVPALTLVGGTARDLNEPIYGIDWSTWEVRTYGDLFMKKDEVRTLDESHNTFVAWMDTGYQICCKSFRNNFVGRATTASST